MPLNLLEADGRWIVSTNSGWRNAYLQVYDEQMRTVVSHVDLPSTWYGLAYDAGRKLVLASSAESSLYVFALVDGRLDRMRELRLDACSLPAGLTLGPEGTLWIACNQSQTVLMLDYLSGRVLRAAKVGDFPYAIARLPQGKLAISLWGQSAIAIVDAATLEILDVVPVGSHPNEMLYLPETAHLLVACSDSDYISIVDPIARRELRRLHLSIPGASLGGAQPVSLARDPASGNIYVSLLGINSVAVLQVKHDNGITYSYRGAFRVGSFPTALFFSVQSRTLFIADGRNPVTGPNAPPQATATRYPKIGEVIGGGIEAFPEAEVDRNTTYSSLHDEVYGHPRAESQDVRNRIAYFSAKPSRPSPIRYVFYILKENRTYDQVLGDITEGNGDPRLVLFGQPVTPNHHALAREFILFDNFFVDGDVSADGHFWSMAGAATDYVSRLWTTVYSGHSEAAFDEPYDGDDKHDSPIAVPGSGFIWDRARKLGITYRDYGEWGVHDPHDKDKDVMYLAGLKNHYDPYYRDEIGDVTDQQRVDEWQREFRAFEAGGKLPRLNIIHLPNDHTCGAKPGYPTPRAMVADNDLALGRMIETISHSRFWPESVILVVEDDAQDGPDHVDAHRSVLLAISPFTHRRAVEHGRFTTASVLKTIEQLLNMGSLTYFDDRAATLLGDFDLQFNLAAYTPVLPTVPLTELNSANSPGAQESARWDFSHPDRAPERELNRVIWQSVRGPDSFPPAPVVQIRLRIP